MTFLHQIGELVRGWMMAVPMPVVRALFVLLPLVLLLWVLRLPRQTVQAPTRHGEKGGANLKLWAAVALALQVVIYLVF